MSRQAIWISEKRRKARAAGLCITCRKLQPPLGRSVCTACVSQVAERRSRRNLLRKQRAHDHRLLVAHERAGDDARSHNLHGDASQYYRDALNLANIPTSDRLRVSEKLAQVLAVGRDPRAASLWLDRVSEAYKDEPVEAKKVVEILLQRARQLWIDARREAALPLLAQAIEIAEADGDRYLRFIANSKMAGYLIELTRYKEASPFMDTCGKLYSDDDTVMRATHYSQQAIVTAALGQAAESIEYFEQAVDAAKETSDILHVIDILSMYSASAKTLGNIQLAKTCLEHALLLVRKHHIVWRTSTLCFGYARTLLCSGQYGDAHEYLLEALSYDVQSPLAETWQAMFGIPVALHAKDEAALAKCARPEAIAFAFRSGEPELIAGTASAFAEWYCASGQKQEAEILLHRVLETVTNVECIWEFPLTTARFGASPDLPRVRKFLELRTELPSAELAYACLALFDAYVAQRTGLPHELHEHVQDAVKRFTLLGWHGYADIARALVPEARVAANAVRERAPFAEMLVSLTARERQVAELVFKKYTNREIADMLGISERTVEAHMTSIMHQLGVRSRYQFDQLV